MSCRAVPKSTTRAGWGAQRCSMLDSRSSTCTAPTAHCNCQVAPAVQRIAFLHKPSKRIFCVANMVGTNVQATYSTSGWFTERKIWRRAVGVSWRDDRRKSSHNAHLQVVIFRTTLVVILITTLGILERMQDGVHGHRSKLQVYKLKLVDSNAGKLVQVLSTFWVPGRPCRRQCIYNFSRHQQVCVRTTFRHGLPQPSSGLLQIQETNRFYSLRAQWLISLFLVLRAHWFSAPGEKKQNKHCLNRGVRGDRFPSALQSGGCCSWRLFHFAPTWLIIRDACRHVFRMLQLASARKIDRTVMAG